MDQEQADQERAKDEQAREWAARRAQTPEHKAWLERVRECQESGLIPEGKVVGPEDIIALLERRIAEREVELDQAAKEGRLREAVADVPSVEEQWARVQEFRRKLLDD